MKAMTEENSYVVESMQASTELLHGRHHRNVGRRYCRNVWRKVVAYSVLVVVALALVWVWPALSDPPRRPAYCVERLRTPDGAVVDSGDSWGYDVLSRRWTCGDHWLIRIGDYGVLGV
jgi:hypothetical protein